MTDRLRRRGEFARNVVTLMTGTTMAQAIPVAISPVLTRMYGPQDFGVLALFVAITSIFGAIANARYELAVMLPESDEDALNIAALGLLVAVTLSAVLMIVVLLFNGPISNLLGSADIGPWLYLAPPVVLFLGLFNVLNYYNNRLKRYRDIARANILKAVVLATVQLAAGALKAGAAGLVAGQVLSSMLANARLLKNTLAHANWRTTVRWQRMKALGLRYADFPKFSMPAILANSLSYNLTNILISSFYSVSTLGFYSLVQRVLGMPSSLLGNSVGQVFFQQATDERRRTGLARKSFDSTVKYLILISTVSFSIIYFVAEDVFAWVFGEQWRIAGTYAKLLAPFFAIRFVVSSVTTINSVFEKQRISLIWQIALMSALLATIIASEIFDIEFTNFIIIFSSVGGICYLLLLNLLFLVSRGRL